MIAFSNLLIAPGINPPTRGQRSASTGGSCAMTRSVTRTSRPGERRRMRRRRAAPDGRQTDPPVRNPGQSLQADLLRVRVRPATGARPAFREAQYFSMTKNSPAPPARNECAAGPSPNRGFGPVFSCGGRQRFFPGKWPLRSGDTPRRQEVGGQEENSRWFLRPAG